MVTLLGPQRRTATVRACVAELMPTGPIATINAGWQEREADTGELADVLGGRMRNLELHRRWSELGASDPAYADAERRLDTELRERQSLYAVRLSHAMAAIDAVARRDPSPARDQAMTEARQAVQLLDRHHLTGVAQARAAFYREVALGDRDDVRRHRREIDELIADSAGVVITGGHVGALLHLLHVFQVGARLKEPLVAWSAGAMALADRVVLFHDFSPYGHRHPEMFAEGLGAYAGVLPFPHARRRLRLDDPAHLAGIADRFAPAVCLLLADGERVDLRRGADGRASLPAGARVLDTQGLLVITPDPVGTPA